MESSPSQIQALITQIKQHIFSPFDPLSFVSPSAYDTAWLAMIPDHPKQGITTPKFKVCLDWIVNNQKEQGFWGEDASDGLPTIDCLPSTLACIVALKTWGVGQDNIGKGLAFIHANSSKLLKENCDHDRRLPRWFVIVFPAMVELAQAKGLEVIFPKDLQGVISNISVKRQQILQSYEEDVDNPPLLAYFEALPPSYIIDEDEIEVKLSGDGSLYQSPSATARAFLVTRNQKCMEYLQALVERCPNGVPNTYPFDGELIRLCLVNQIQRLGLAEHFTQEIDEILEVIYRNYKNRELKEIAEINLVAARIYKDSLAFRLLRLHGYNVTSRSFCWFIYDEDIRGHMERKFEYFTSALYNVYRATDLMFSGEFELEEARLFSKKLLEKSLKLRSIKDNPIIFSNFQMVIEYELTHPWIARLDHLDHRMWIERNKVDTLLIGKDSFHRLSCLLNDKLMQLAVENYNFRQSIYRTELEELSRWSKEWGLSEMGFGREKTAYCYFAIASSTCLPLDSSVRIIIAKSAILVTVADDFFDMEGCLDDLQTLTQAVQRWDGEDLSGHGKTIFRALNNIVSEIVENHFHQQGSDITKNLRDLWGETFGSWMIETTWSKTGYVPSLDEYLQVGMTSIATHTMILPALCFLNYDLKSDHYETITQLLMASCRLLNDIQSYQKELEVGKKNFVILNSKAINPKAGIENSINHVKGMLDEMKRELLEHALMDGFNVLPKTCNHFHLSILRVFYMFFNSSNVFDSTTELLHDINKAIYVPIGWKGRKQKFVIS